MRFQVRLGRRRPAIEWLKDVVPMCDLGPELWPPCSFFQ